MEQSAASAFAAPAGDSAISTAAAAAAPPAANQTWYDGASTPDLKNWIQAKGFKDGVQAAESAWNLEKLIGHDKAGRTVVMPGENATPEEIKAFQSKMGVPADPKEYMAAIKVPEGQSPEFANEAAKWFHEAGLTPKQATLLADKWNAYGPAAQEQMQKQTVERSNQEFTAVVSEWGKTADQNIELGKRAAQMFIPAANAEERAALMSKIEAGMGTGAMLKMFANIGKNLGEHQLADNGDKSGNASVAEAQAKRASLMGNPNWARDYATNKTKQDEMWKLNQIIAGQSQ